MNLPVTLLCRNPSTNQDKRIEQALMCAVIDGYTDATAELSRFITRLYRENNENASLIHNTLKPLIKQQGANYNKLCDELNEINSPKTHVVRVFFNDGDELVTRFNGTVEEVNEYYLDQEFNMGAVNDFMKRCIGIEIVDN